MLGIIYVVIGIVDIIMGALALFTGIAMLNAFETQAVTEQEITVTAVVLVASIFSIISGVVSLICGIFANRAADDNQKWRGAWVIAIISFIVAIIGVISSIVTRQATIAPSVISAIWAVLILWLCNNVKHEALGE